MTDNKKLWEGVLVEVELNVSKANFNTWFKETYIIKQEEGTVFLSVPNAFVKTWLQDKFHKFILNSLRTQGGDIRGLEYIVSKDDGKKRIIEQKTETLQNPTNELPLQDYYVNKEDNLNPRYTLESFIVGPFNQLAHAAALTVIKKPGQAYNPFFIYGNTGLGKTHLIQAIGNTIKTQNPMKKVYYITSEKFAIDYNNSLQSNKINIFKDKYRKYDVLIMDDIQFFSKLKKLKRNFFIFSTLSTKTTSKLSFLQINTQITSQILKIDFVHVSVQE